MIPVPEEQLKELQCHQCGGILSSGPVLVSLEGSQLCGICSKRLSRRAQTGLVRQVAYEALAGLMSFPCRYSSLRVQGGSDDSVTGDDRGHGCDAWLAWNAAPQHELVCPHRPSDDKDSLTSLTVSPSSSATGRTSLSSASSRQLLTSVDDLGSLPGDECVTLVEVDDGEHDYVEIMSDKSVNYKAANGVDESTTDNKHKNNGQQTALNSFCEEGSRDHHDTQAGNEREETFTNTETSSSIQSNNKNNDDNAEGRSRRSSSFIYENFCPVYDYVVKKDLAYFIPSNEHLSVEIWFDLNQNRSDDGNEQERTLFKYRIEIQGNKTKGSRLGLVNDFEQHRQTDTSYNAIKIVMDGRVTSPAVAVTKPAKNISCDVSVHSLRPNPSGDPRPNRSNRISRTDFTIACMNCQNIIDMAIYQCKYGHVMCINCRTTRCQYCTQTVDPSPLFCCKFHKRGCKSTLSNSQRSLHEIDCEYGFHRCPLETIRRCSDVEGTLYHIRNHVHESHSSDLLLNDTVITKSANRDDCWIMLGHDSIFRCRYWCTDVGVEFIVQYVGAQFKAKEYKYEVSIVNPLNIEDGKLMGSSKCFGRNEVNLETGVTISKRKLERYTDVDGNVSYKMRIFSK